MNPGASACTTSFMGGSRLLLLTFIVYALGCASGGGDTRGRRDSGTPAHDAGTGQLDARVGSRDSGRTSPDAGTSQDGGTTTEPDSGGGSTCGESPCRLVAPQCGCPAGQGCYVGAGGARTCGTSGPEREGQACSGATACEPGNLCVNAGAGSLCARFCNSDADCTGGAGSICLLTLDDGSGGALPGVKLCTIHCSPTGASGCPNGAACAIYEEEATPMRAFTSCRSAGTGTAGATCTSTEDCAQGYFCANTGGATDECVQFCTYPSGLECTSGFCNAFEAPGLVVGGVEYGYCL